METSLIDLRRPITLCRASAGTGKTYTLAAYYVGLLLSGEDYRSILAITFTNKATAEMSERILGYLYGLSRGEERAFLARARQFMIRDSHLSDEDLSRRAGECFKHMLLDYDNVQVMTIDSFLQTLLGGLASVLQESAGVSTELDIDHVIRQAVDQLLTTEMQASDRAIIEDYMRLKLDEESQWDVRESLCGLAKELYNESVQMLDAEGRILFDAPSIQARRAAVEALWENHPDVQTLRTMLESFDTEKYNKFTLYGYNRLCQSVKEPHKMAAADRFRGVSERSCNAPEMLQATALAERIARFYNTIQLTIRFSRDMELMASLQALINRNLHDANCALLAHTAGKLSKALSKGDADFILEKAGIRYRHILMDEFQDTSRLQWTVIRQLLLDVLAGEGHTLLIVGDIKQSIYRWRNGDWHIMDGLGNGEDAMTHERINERFTSLTRNFRSCENVVRFNLSLFDHIIRHYAYTEGGEDELAARIYGEGYTPEQIKDFYRADKPDGFVRFRAFPKGNKQQMTMDMFDAIEELLARGAQPSDMMILVRDKKDAALITDLHMYMDPEQEAFYPHLMHTAIVSADSFLLDASEDVRTVIAGLKLLVNHDEVAQAFIERKTGKTDIATLIHQRLSVRTPLYEAMSELIRLLITDENGQYKGSETAYINNLLDRTRAYVSAYGSSISDFLVYWEDTLRTKSIPAPSSDAIRILTIHASKGLQAQTLFVPFCTWTREAGKHAQKIWCPVDETVGGTDFVPIQDGTEMENSEYAYAYKDEHRNMRIDNLNMLYVALTRAEDNLYISADFSVTSKGALGACNHVGRYLLDFCELNEAVVLEDLPTTRDEAPYAEYTIGTPIISRPKTSAKVDDKPFSFSNAPSGYAEVWANSDQVRFIQSQEGALYTDYGDESYRRVARMEEGTLCHEIFASLRQADELDRVLDAFETRGEIRDAAQREQLKALISSAWKGNEQMKDWFTSPWLLKLEQPIYIDHRELRPDRVMINPETNEAIVLDYKFGSWNDHYLTQVSEYKQALARMGYHPVSGYLWFAKENRLVEVKK